MKSPVNIKSRLRRKNKTRGKPAENTVPPTKCEDLELCELRGSALCNHSKNPPMDEYTFMYDEVDDNLKSRINWDHPGHAKHFMIGSIKVTFDVPSCQN